MKTILLAAVCLLSTGCKPPVDSLVHRVSELEERGAFKEADSLLTAALADETDDSNRSTLLFERERLDRIRKDYPFSEEQIWNQISRRIKGPGRSEYEAWKREGRFDWRTIDGEERFLAPSVSNLFWRYDDIRLRRIDPLDNAEFSRHVLRNAREIVMASKTGGMYVLPKTFRVTMRIRVTPNVADGGSTIRAWLPVPRMTLFQTDFRMIESSSLATVDVGESPIRSAYLEQPSIKDSATVFWIEYEYRHAGISFDLRREDERPIEVARPEISRFLSESPHVVFSEGMRALSREIAGVETSRVELARSFYNWITDSVAYGYAAEYSTIRNIGEYCLQKKYGDCGQEAFLYITLCRLNGIPARWQSGWFTFPKGKTIHDWVSIYLEPWGWVPVDPYMGIFANRYLSGVTEGERKEIRDFYFGGLDQYRISANADHNQELRPSKRSLRSDNVDFQRGELEFNETNIYFDKYSFRLDIEEVVERAIR